MIDLSLFMRRRWAEARLKGVPATEEQPLDPHQCLEDFLAPAPYEFNFADQVLFSLYRSIFRNSSRPVRGPITTVLSFCGLPIDTVTFPSILHRVRCTASYSKTNQWRNDTTLL